MRKILPVLSRLFWFFLLLPETCSNCIRFRVLFVLPRWFKMPAKVHVEKRSIILQFLNEEGVAADFITCFLRNAYGLGRKLEEVRTIIDVGANVGFFSLAARARYPGARIHAYEPNPRIQQALRANVSGLDIHIYQEAVSNSDGYVTMIDVGPSDQARTRISEDSGGGIPQVSLGHAIERIGGSVDLLKLDCEGAEWEILTPSDHWKSVRNIRMEYHLFDRETVEQATAALTGFGFEIIHLRRQSEHGGVIWAQRA
jgi:FkbM family methyltransferase